ncbi:undecaprenyl-diphosphate phosphatase [Nostocoides sp. F2B08]|uniref:undecaprenyl-diphosphate phosphatase n=1 Tax=Nostocoides sp. F2B08 TaxID=2653936 RepID=UPI00126396FD|nr:undecaprenyl-diphosphate phosphatase [Tetrasphaera sp. F2B08]KAB7745205.1 undecaprenyl-diphosphate phosphatase [Tetrasphaera sp. F2B08]
MTWLEAIILGIVQGLTEFLPISSSAHLLIVGQLFFDGRDPGAAFTAVSQIGTEMAVVVYFAKDIGRIISKWFRAFAGKVPQSDPDVRMGWMVIVGSIPIGVLGLLFEDAIDSGLRNLWITATMLAGVALVLFIADRRAKNERTLDQLTWRHAISLGLWQALALIPGVSRSGATISGGLLMGYRREAAARYAFLLAVPAVLASGFYKLKDIGDDATAAWGPTILATAIAFVIGYAVIAWLLRYVATHTFTIFVVYRLVLAGVLVVLLATGTIAAT